MPQRSSFGSDGLKLGAALFAVAALAAWFLRAPAEGPDLTEKPAVTVLLVDRSASVTRSRPLWRRWVVRRIGAAVGAASARGDEVALVVFDEGAQRAAGPVPAQAFIDELHRRSQEWFGPQEQGTDLGTDLKAAAEVADALVSEPGRGPGTIVVLGDGDFTGEDPSDALLRPELRALEHGPPPEASRVDLGVVRVHTPREVAPGALVPVELDLFLTGPTLGPGRRVLVNWQLELTGTDAATRGRRLTTAPDGEVTAGMRLGGTAEAEVPMSALRAGDGMRQFSTRIVLPGAAAGSASLSIRVALEGSGADPIPENDEGRAGWRIGDPVRVAVVAPRASLAQGTALFTGAALDGIEFRGVPLERLAAVLSGPVEELPDAVVTIELPYAALPAQLLEAFVRERGGGWIHSSGWPYLRTDAPEGLLALAALEPDLEPKPPRDIVMFVDGSGSMEGPRWERMRAALRQLVPSIPSSDTLSLRFFTRSMGDEEFRLEPLDGTPERAAEREAALRWLARVYVPGGATDILVSLNELTKSRGDRPHADDSDEPDGLVILVSDGETRSNSQRRENARERLRRGRDQLVAIHVGDGRGATFLKGLLPLGEDVIQAGELEGLLDVLQEAVHDLSVIEGGRLVAVEPDDEVDPLLRAALAEVGRRLPEGDGALSCARALPARPTADASALVALGSEALTLAGRRSVFAAAAARGRGFTVGLAAPLLNEVGPSGAEGKRAPDSDWAPAVRRRPGWLGPLFRASARTRDLADLALQADEAVALEATWTHDARTLFGSATKRRGSFLLLEGLGSGAPERLRAAFRWPASMASNGERQAGELIAEAEVEWLPTAKEPRQVRAVIEPLEVRSLARGRGVVLELFAPDDPSWSTEPIELGAPGPLEIRFGAGGGRRGVASALAVASFRSRIAASDPAGPGGGGDERPKDGHPAVPWILAAGFLAVLAGALSALRAT